MLAIDMIAAPHSPRTRDVGFLQHPAVPSRIQQRQINCPLNIDFLNGERSENIQSTMCSDLSDRVRLSSSVRVLQD